MPATESRYPRAPIATASLLAAVFTALLSLSACDGGPDGMEPEDGQVASRAVGAQGGTLTSTDGQLTLSIPAGALGTTETITIETITAGDLGPAFDELVDALGVKHAYELGPDGLAFQRPVTVHLASDQVPVQDGDSLRVFAEFLFTSANGTLEVLDSLRVEANADSNTVAISGQLTHFSPFFDPLQVTNGVYFALSGVPKMLEVGGAFEADVLIASTMEGPLGGMASLVGPARYLDDADAPLAPTFDGAPEVEIPLDDDAPEEAATRFKGTFGYTCTEAGLGLFDVELQVEVTFDLDAGPVTETTFANFTGGVDCVEAMPPPDDLRVTLAGDGAGRVTSSPAGIACPDDCNEPFARGTAVTLTAEPDEGAVFAGWSGEAPADCGTAPTCSFAVDEARDEITATFTAAGEAAPSILEFGGEPTGPRTVDFSLRIGYDYDLSDLDVTIDPDDGSGPQPVELEATGGEDEYEGSLEWEYGEGTMFPAMPKATVTSTETGEGDSRAVTIEEVTLTLRKSGSGDGTVTGATGVFGPVEVLTCGPGCTEESAQSLRLVNVSGEVRGLPFLLDAYPDDVSVFAGWSGDVDGGEGCDDHDAFDGGTCLVEMSRDRTVTATFLNEGTAVLAIDLFLFKVGLIHPEAAFYIAGAVQGWGYGGSKSYQDKVAFGDLSGTFITAFSGADGFVVVDLLTEEVLLDGTGIGDAGPYFGVIGLSETPAGPGSPATLFAFGQNGYGFFDTSGEGATTTGPTTFDAFPAGGDPLSGWATVVQPDVGVRFIAYDAGAHRFTSETIPAGAFADQLVSAFLPDDGTPGDNPLLVLDRAVESGLYLVRRDGSAPARVADVGLDARKIRCLDAGGTLVCGITVFGDDAVVLVTWDGQGTPSVVGTVPAGDGPVDLGLMPLANGNVGLVTTGFNDGTVTEVEIAPGGSVVNSSTRAVLDGCRSPGHALYVRDETSLKVVGTCYDSNTYFVMESSL